MLTRIAAFVALMLGMAATASAQDLAAILMHDGNPTVFKGIDGLKNAAAAAQDGDLITLSAGTFNGCEITKGVTIIGAGFGLDGEPSTVINSDITINNQSEGSRVKIEGILNWLYLGNSVDGTSPKKIKIKTKQPIVINKARIGYIDRDNNFKDSVSLSVSKAMIYRNYIPGAILQNCLISGYGGAEIYATNCTFYSYPGKNSICHNSLIHCDGGVARGDAPSDSVYTSWSLNFCKVVSSNYSSIGEWVDTNSSNSSSYKFSNDGNYIFTEKTYRLKLKDEYAAEWLGSDGTQVGAYGGSDPFNPVSSLPKITKFSVAEKTTADGTLNVEISLDPQQ